MNLTNIIKFMSEGHDGWQPIAIVDIIPSEEKMSGYPNHDTCRIKEDKHLYLKTTASELDDGSHPIKFYYVVQWGHFEDSYSGFLLLPYGKRFLKVSFSC